MLPGLLEFRIHKQICEALAEVPVVLNVILGTQRVECVTAGHERSEQQLGSRHENTSRDPHREVMNEEDNLNREQKSDTVQKITKANERQRSAR
jgi:hypothetical protein